MDVQIIRSNRKSVSIQLKPNQPVTVRAPYGVPKQELERILRKKEAWIRKNLAAIEKQEKEREQRSRTCPTLSVEELQKLRTEAARYIPDRVQYYAPIVGVEYSRITIRTQKTRWGSCSAKGGLNFNCLLMLTPLEVIDYVVVHELCHRKEMNHSPAFWQEVKNVLPDYQTQLTWLKKEGSALIRRIPPS